MKPKRAAAGSIRCRPPCLCSKPIIGSGVGLRSERPQPVWPAQASPFAAPGPRQPLARWQPCPSYKPLICRPLGDQQVGRTSPWPDPPVGLLAGCPACCEGCMCRSLPAKPGAGDTAAPASCRCRSHAATAPSPATHPLAAAGTSQSTVLHHEQLPGRQPHAHCAAGAAGGAHAFPGARRRFLCGVAGASPS